MRHQGHLILTPFPINVSLVRPGDGSVKPIVITVVVTVLIAVVIAVYLDFIGQFRQILALVHSNPVGHTLYLLSSSLT